MKAVESGGVDRATREDRLQVALAGNAARRNRSALSAALDLSGREASFLSTAIAKDLDARAAAFAEDNSPRVVGLQHERADPFLL